MRVKAAVTLVVLCFACMSVPMASADSLAEARAHFRSATSHFAVGEFELAAREYQSAYKLKPDPALLYNAAQAFRLAGNNKQALMLYRNYANFYPKGPNMAGVREQMDRLEEIVNAEERAKNAPPHSTAEPQPDGPERVPDATPVVAAAPQKSQPHADRTPLYKKWWLWTIVGVVVAGGVVAGAVVGTQKPAAWSTGSEIGPGSKATGLTVRW